MNNSNEKSNFPKQSKSDSSLTGFVAVIILIVLVGSILCIAILSSKQAPQNTPVRTGKLVDAPLPVTDSPTEKTVEERLENLCKKLQSDDPEVQRKAALDVVNDVLSQGNRDAHRKYAMKAVPILLATFENNQDEQSRREVALALVRIAPQKAGPTIPVLVAMLKNKRTNSHERRFIARGLTKSKIGIQALKELVTKAVKTAPWASHEAVLALASTDSKEVKFLFPQLIEVLTDKGMKWNDRASAARGVVRCGYKGLKAVREVFSKANSGGRSALLRSLTMKKGEGVEVVFAGLLDSNSYVRQVARERFPWNSILKHIYELKEPELYLRQQGIVYLENKARIWIAVIRRAANESKRIKIEKARELLLVIPYLQVLAKKKEEKATKVLKDLMEFAKAMGDFEKIHPNLLVETELIKAASHESEVYRLVGVDGLRLAKCRGSHVRRTLYKCLKISSDKLQLAAVRALGKLDIRVKEFPHLINLLDNTDHSDILVELADILGQYGYSARSAATAMSNRLTHKEYTVRRRLVFALARIEAKLDNRTIPAFVEVALQEKDQKLRSASLATLARSKAAVAALTKHLSDPMYSVRYKTVLALLDINAPLDETTAVPFSEVLVTENDWELHDRITKALRTLTSKQQEVLQILKSHLKGKYPTRRNAVLAIVKLDPKPGKSLVSHLIKVILEETDWIIRVRAVKGLGKIGPDARSAVPILTSLLNDKRIELRRAVHASLEKIRGK